MDKGNQPWETAGSPHMKLSSSQKVRCSHTTTLWSSPFPTPQPPLHFTVSHTVPFYFSHVIYHYLKSHLFADLKLVIAPQRAGPASPWVPPAGFICPECWGHTGPNRVWWGLWLTSWDFLGGAGQFKTTWMKAGASGSAIPMVKGWGQLGVLCTMRVSAVSTREAMSTLSQMWNRGSGVGAGAGLESCRQSHIKNRVRRIYCLSPLEFYNSQRRQGPISLVHFSTLHV